MQILITQNATNLQTTSILFNVNGLLPGMADHAKVFVCPANVLKVEYISEKWICREQMTEENSD